MDYLDPKKQFRHHVILFVGYVLVAVAIVIATLILLYQAYGFGLEKDGTVIQNGLTFFSSQPNPAKIYINGSLKNASTNTRLVLPAGIYQIKLTRDGYRDWQRTIDLNGGSVKHLDYPFLFPKTLTTTKVQTYTAAPKLSTQSPDRRWLVVGQAGSMTNFDVYDLKNPSEVAKPISLPEGVLSKATASESWLAVEWADDNQHLLVRHNFDDKTEFILIDRLRPELSLNLNNALAANPTQLTLRDKKFDQYYIFDAGTATLQTGSLKSPTKSTVLQRVLAYKSYEDDTLLYVTDNAAPLGKVLVKMAVDSKTSTIRSLPAGTSYLIDFTKYDGSMYVAAGAGSGNKVYIYKDPLGQLQRLPNQAVSPIQVLHVEQPSFLSFSPNAQFIVAQNVSRFGVYDIENKVGHNYSTPVIMDAPQTHASWMDGNRLLGVSAGKQIVFDYDSYNKQTLMNASSLYLPAYTPDYKSVYSLVASPTDGQFELTRTSLLTVADQ